MKPSGGPATMFREMTGEHGSLLDHLVIQARSHMILRTVLKRRVLKRKVRKKRVMRTMCGSTRDLMNLPVSMKLSREKRS